VETAFFHISMNTQAQTLICCMETYTP